VFFTSSVDIPERLVDAQRNGDLVVFVGAGASIDPPSGLPSFPSLTEQILRDAQQTEPSRLIRDQPDVVLGKLDAGPTAVHQRVRDLIGRPDSRPNRLHHSIAGLFRSAESVRLVTTNYDRHLETALWERWNQNVEVFRAPAMPLGGDFSGVVCLHGDVSQDPRRLVVTDEDFGRAYLTEAWAARFVHDMFTASPVLFIGYSHSDRVMTYLARGLPRDHHGRYALVPQRDDSSLLWQSLRIIPVSYPLRRGNRPHLELTLTVEAWAADARMGLLDHAVTTRTLSSRSAPPSDPVGQSYLIDVLGDPNRITVFATHAKGMEWLDWVLAQDCAKALFQPNAILTSPQLDLANWFAREIFPDPQRIVSAAHLLGPSIHPSLWFELARTVWINQRTDRGTVAKWVPSLLSTAPRDASTFLEYILTGCEWPTDRAPAILLFDWLIEPRWSVSPWSQIELRGDPHWLKEAWSKHFVPHLEDHAMTLLPTLYRHLESAFLMLLAAGRSSKTFDQMSYGRSAIEPHQQDQFSPDGINTLIDACRDVLVFLLEHDREVGIGFLRSMEQSEVPLLGRIAVHGWTERSDVDGSVRLNWLLDRDLVWDFAAKHEVFRLIRQSLPDAQLSSKQRLLREILQGPPPTDPPEAQDPALNAYSIFNYLAWLTESDPAFQDATEALSQIRVQWPDFEVREHPDMDHWTSGGFVGPRWPMKPEELITRDPNDVLSELLAYRNRPTTLFEPSWRDVCGLVTEVVKRDSAWGFRVAAALGQLDEWRSELWDAVIYGWLMGSLSPEEWIALISVLLQHPSPSAIRRSAAELLDHGSRPPQGTTPISVIPMASTLANRLWETPDEDEPHDLDSGGWLQTALNRWSGKIALFWLHSIERQWQARSDQWTGLDIETGDTLKQAITGAEAKNGYARSIFAGQLHFLAAADLHWSSDNIVPLLDWDRDPLAAEQAWDGYLTWAQWTQPLLPALMPLYLQSVVRLPADESQRRNRLFEHLAGIVLFGSVERFGPKGWLDRAIVTATPADRAHFAQHVGRNLNNAPPEFAQNAFEEWIERYWRRRLEGIPMPLEAEEGLEMADWLLHSGDRFATAVDLFTKSPLATSQSHRMFLHDLEVSGFVQGFPAATAALVLALIRSFSGPVHDPEHLEAIVRLLAPALTDPPDRSILSEICGEAVRLRIPHADTWI
jgi:hypothetical protein